MPIADTKKSQAIRNLWHERVAKKLLEVNADVAAIRIGITTHNLTGNFTAGELTAMADVETDVIAIAVLPGVTAAEGKYQSTHGNHAISIPGVND